MRANVGISHVCGAPAGSAGRAECGTHTLSGRAMPILWIGGFIHVVHHCFTFVQNIPPRVRAGGFPVFFPPFRRGLWPARLAGVGGGDACGGRTAWNWGLDAGGVDAQAALALPIGGEASITLPRLGTLAVVHDRDEKHLDGDVTWVGHFRDYGTDYRVLITSGPKGLAGRISSPDGEFSLLPGNGGAWLRDNQAAGLKPLIQEQDDTIHVQPSASVAQGQPATAAAAPAGLPPAQSVIDLMLVYTPGMVQRYGDGLQTRLNNLVAIANQAYIDSGVHITLRLVHTELVNYSETTNITTAWIDLSSGKGVFANIPALRSQYGADLVQMIRPFYGSVGACGLAGASVPASTTGHYSVVEDGRDMVGNSFSFCQDVALVHELGHNLGANHDRAHTVCSSWL